MLEKEQTIAASQAGFDLYALHQMVKELVDIVGLPVAEVARQADISRTTADRIYRDKNSNTSHATYLKIFTLWKVFEGPIKARSADSNHAAG